MSDNADRVCNSMNECIKGLTQVKIDVRDPSEIPADTYDPLLRCAADLKCDINDVEKRVLEWKIKQNEKSCDYQRRVTPGRSMPTENDDSGVYSRDSNKLPPLNRMGVYYSTNIVTDKEDEPPTTVPIQEHGSEGLIAQPASDRTESELERTPDSKDATTNTDLRWNADHYQ